MLDEIMSLANLPEKLQQFISLVTEAADKYQEAEKAEALNEADAMGREKAGALIDDAAVTERLAREMTRCAYALKPDSEIFPDAYRREFTEAFLQQYPAALPYRRDVEEIVRQWFRKLEGLLRDNYSKGERVILRRVMQTQADLDELRRGQAETLSLLRSKRDFTTSNQDYKEIFEAPLFLHKGNSRVCLRNLFVPHRFREERGQGNGINLPDKSMDEYLTRFVRDKEARFLFIEGDAGCGKSSLTAYLSWHYEQSDRTAKDIFGDAQLMTVRLRNINVPTDGRKDERLTLGVLRFLYGDKESDREIIKRFRESGARVLLLDGYDELCTTDGIENPESALETLKNLDCKIIVTTRPNYIRFQRFGKFYWHIALEHFDGAQRRKWLERYRNCGETLEEVNRNYLERIGDGETAGICDTPMGLYMVAAGHFTPDALENEWAVYRQIFYRELSETEYNQIFQGISVQHGIQEYQELLYRVSEEMAWYLYQRNNENLLIPDSEITRIIGELDISEGERKTVERCFALCGYWKANTGRGCVEFYHNNIRDFFLCEKLMRELNGAYREYGDALRDERGDITPFLQRLCGLFQYGKLEKTVLFFLEQRAAYADKEPDLCADTERKERHTARILEALLLRGDCYSVCAERMSGETPVKIVGRILNNTVAAYRSLYEAFLNPGERIRLWTNQDAVNQGGALRQLATEMLEYAGPSDLRKADLRGADLRYANLRGADLRYANLRGADLYYADLRGANLEGADLRRAYLSGANLEGAVLETARLGRAELASANLEGANLHNSNLVSAYLKKGADLRRASLYHTDAGLAHFEGANLRGADLRGAEGYHLEDTTGTPITDEPPQDAAHEIEET